MIQADEAKVKVAEMVGEKVDNKTKMEIIMREQEIIAAEKEQQIIEQKVMCEMKCPSYFVSFFMTVLIIHIKCKMYP